MKAHDMIHDNFRVTYVPKALPTMIFNAVMVVSFIIQFGL